MAGRSVRLVAGLAATSTTGDPLVTQASDFFITQAGDQLVTQSSAGVLSVHATSATLTTYTKTVELLAGLAATSEQAQPLITQAGDLIVTQAGDRLVLQALAVAAGSSLLTPSVVLTGS